MKILFHIDNKSVVDSINSGLPKDKHLAFLVRRLAILSMQYSFKYKAVHVPGRENVAADSLSRLNLEFFRNIHPTADPVPTEVPSMLIRELLLISPEV